MAYQQNAVPEISVHELQVMTEAEWSFRDNAPKWRWRDYRSVGTFDPFPAYPHNFDDVVEAAGYVQDCCTPRWNVELFVADREEAGRSNGFSTVRESGRYVGDEYVKDPLTGLIVLSGKRVPPHPAVTRYLVAHEYGHNVQWMVSNLKGMTTVHDTSWMDEYVEVRGLGPEHRHHGSGGRWHDGIDEIFACDFRILVCEVEPDYWPHPGITYPTILPRLVDWWRQITEEMAGG